MKTTLKKIVLVGLPLAFFACEPMEDVYDELDIDNVVVQKNVVVTLSSSDYNMVDNDYFTSVEEAAENIPTFLDSKYGHLDDGSSVEVTYNQLVFDFSSGNEVASVEQYEVTAADYKETTGNDYGNFDNLEDIVGFLDNKFGDLEEFSIVILDYLYYANGSTNNKLDAFYKVGDSWKNNTYLVTPEDYEATGNGRYDNFTGADDDKLAGYFNHFLGNIVTLQPSVGDVMHVVYYYFSGSAAYQIMTMAYDGSKWYEVTETITRPETIKFAKKAGIWEPDISIAYTLTAADYTWIADNSTAGSAGARGNLKSYGNFAASYWPRPDLIDAFSQLLNERFPNVEVGQRYQLTYLVYSGGVAPQTMTLEKLESGGWAESE